MVGATSRPSRRAVAWLSYMFLDGVKYAGTVSLRQLFFTPTRSCKFTVARGSRDSNFRNKFSRHRSVTLLRTRQFKSVSAHFFANGIVHSLPIG